MRLAELVSPVRGPRRALVSRRRPFPGTARYGAVMYCTSVHRTERFAAGGDSEGDNSGEKARRAEEGCGGEGGEGSWLPAAWRKRAGRKGGVRGCTLPYILCSVCTCITRMYMYRVLVMSLPYYQYHASTSTEAQSM